jgi:hypothetical protein
MVIIINSETILSDLYNLNISGYLFNHVCNQDGKQMHSLFHFFPFIMSKTPIVWNHVAQEIGE